MLNAKIFKTFNENALRCKIESKKIDKIYSCLEKLNNTKLKCMSLCVSRNIFS